MSSTFSQNTSSSSTSPVQTPENQIINQISNVASSMAQQLYSWAQGAYAQTSAITNQTVSNFFQVSQNMLGLSGNMTSQYNNLFAPENAQLVQDANSYNSTARQQADMGMAGATAKQAGDQSEANATQQLQAFGIDPSSGRYAALLNADNVQNAANVAGAENAQRVSDTATGQQLRAEAVQVGAQLPSSIANINNTALQANTGAENATLANANTGAALMSLPNSYLSTAMNVKMPFSSTQGSSQGSSNSNKPESGSSGNSGSGGGGINPMTGSSGSQAWDPASNYTQSSTSGGGSSRGQPNSAISHLNPGPDGQPGPGETDPMSSMQTGNGSIGGDNIFDPIEGVTDTTGLGSAGGGIFDQDPWQNASGSIGAGEFGNSEAGDNTFGNIPQSDPINNSGIGDITYDPSQNIGDFPPAPESSGSSDSGNYGSSGGGDSSDDSGGDGWGNYAGGGAIQGRSSGMGGGTRPVGMGGGIQPHAGPVPQQLSPSGGRKVDDVRAQGPGGANLHLNANEFVIPQDVALWKGQEFFQNLINQSRQKRVMGSAKPTTGAQPQPQQPTR